MKLVLFPNKILQFTCRPYNFTSRNTNGTVENTYAWYYKQRQLIDIPQMLIVMYKYGGCGLAANQVGNKYRVFVMNETGDEEQKLYEKICFNPIISLGPKKITVWEGCLSLPGHMCQVKRATSANLRYQTESGRWVNEQLTGTAAQIAQHEIDHLNGILVCQKT